MLEFVLQMHMYIYIYIICVGMCTCTYYTSMHTCMHVRSYVHMYIFTYMCMYSICLFFSPAKLTSMLTFKAMLKDDRMLDEEKALRYLHKYIICVYVHMAIIVYFINVTWFAKTQNNPARTEIQIMAWHESYTLALSRLIALSRHTDGRATNNQVCFHWNHKYHFCDTVNS